MQATTALKLNNNHKTASDLFLSHKLSSVFCPISSTRASRVTRSRYAKLLLVIAMVTSCDVTYGAPISDLDSMSCSAVLSGAQLLMMLVLASADQPNDRRRRRRRVTAPRIRSQHTPMTHIFPTFITWKLWLAVTRVERNVCTSSGNA